MADWSSEYRDRTVNSLARADKETFKKIYDNRVNQDEGRRNIIEWQQKNASGKDKKFI